MTPIDVKLFLTTLCFFLCSHTVERPADILGLEPGTGFLAVPGNAGPCQLYLP